jgi:hypothetical protein
VLLAVYHLTGCYSKVADRVYVAQIAEIAQLDEHRTQKALAFWHRLGVIEWHGSSGRGRPSWVSLPNDSEKTRPLLNVVGSDLNGERENSPKNPVSSGPLPRRFTEEVLPRSHMPSSRARLRLCMEFTLNNSRMK